MRNSALLTQKGFYEPSFLRLTINENVDLCDLNKLAPKHYSTFFHEYNHYLQDMTTTFGLTNTNIVGNRLKFYVKDVELSPSSTFGVPIPIPPTDPTNYNKDLQVVYMGQASLGNMDPAKVVINTVGFVPSTAYLPAPHNKYLEEVNVNFTYAGKTYDYKFGGIALMETMTHLIQSKFYPVTPPAFPYHAAELVAKKVYPTIGNNPEFVFALCDICLLDSHPGRAFLKMLEAMADPAKPFVPKIAEDIYNFVHGNIYMPTGETLTDIFIKTSNEAEALYESLFESPTFANEKAWMKAVVSSGRNMRVTRPTFMLDIYREGSASGTKMITVVSIMGTPLMFNKNGDACFLPPHSVQHLSITPDRLAAIMEVFKLFDDGQKYCRLTDFCSLHIATDHHCTSSPWARTAGPDLCVYAQLWKTWDLIGKTPL